MDKLRRVIIHKSETGYMFSIKDLGNVYSEAAPVSKVIPNGPADSAGLRPGDGLVAINSNLVKGKTHADLYNIIKSCRGVSLELTVIEDYFSSTSPNFQQNKLMTTDERKRATNNSTPLSIEEDPTEEESFSYSPVIIKKKAYTYDKADFQRFTNLEEELSKPFTSESDLYSEISIKKYSQIDKEFIHSTNNKFQSTQPKINYKPAKNNCSASTTKSEMDIDVVDNSPSSTADTNRLVAVNSKMTRYDPSKLVYHPAYKQHSNKKQSCLNNRLLIDSQQNNCNNNDRRGSSPSMSESITSKSKSNRQCRNPVNLYRKASQTSQLSKSSCQNSSPKLQLNRVGGLVRAPLSVDETIDLENDADHNDIMLYSIDTLITDHSSETGATNESGRSSCDLDNLENSGKPKYRYFHCSPVPYKSSNISSSSSLPLEVTPKNETSHLQFAEDITTKLSKKCELVRSNSENESGDEVDHNNLYQCEPNPDSSMEEYIQDKEEIVLDFELKSHQNSKNFKNLKNILGDNYRGRSKTLDSDRKLKDDEDEFCATTVMVKWIIYDGKTAKSLWKQYTIDIEDNRLVLNRETNLTTASTDETSMIIPLLNAIVEEEPEKRGRKNTLKISHAGKQSECLIEFSEKSLANKWLRTLCEKTKPDKDDRSARSASFKERHSLTVPNLYSKEAPLNQNQFIKSKTKNKENLQSNTTTTAVIPITFPQTNKNVIQQTMSRVKKLKYKFASSHVSEFERQQEEWFNRPSIHGKLVGSSSCSEDMHGSIDGGSFTFQGSSYDSKQQIQSFEYGHMASLPLHKWQRSITSYLIPLTVELCISIIENYGMNHVGLYRVSGNKIALDYICAELRKPVSEIDVQTDKWNDLHAISGVLKSFFRNLSDGLFPKENMICNMFVNKSKTLIGSFSDLVYQFTCNECNVTYIGETSGHWEKATYQALLIIPIKRAQSIRILNGISNLYSDIIGACRMHEGDRERRLLSIQRFLSIMDIAQDHPEYRYHRETLRYLMEHLSRVASRQATNKMNAKNLAVIFAPTLMKPPQETNEILVNDYKYQIQLIEALIKHHKWLFSPTLESACNVPPDIDDEDLKSTPSDDLPFPIELYDNKDIVTGVTDARPLVKEILEKVKFISKDNFENLENFSNNCSKTLIELSREAYEESAIDIGYKEVDIDEECEKRKGNENNSILKLKMATGQILDGCTKDISELKDIQQQCRESLLEINEKIQKIDQEILKTEHIMDTNPEKHSSKKVVASLYDIPGKNLSNLSRALASPKAHPLEQHSIEGGSQKSWEFHAING